MEWECEKQEDTESREWASTGENRCSEDAESCATAESSRIRTSAGSFEIKTKIQKIILKANIYEL